MDSLSFLTQGSDETKVDDLLCQLNDEYLMQMNVNTHSLSSTKPAVSLSDEKWDKTLGGLDSDLMTRLEKLKLASARRSGGVYAESKEKVGPVNSEITSVGGDDVIGRGDGDSTLRERQSCDSNQVSCSKSPSTETPEDLEDVDADLMARFLALKGTPRKSCHTRRKSQVADSPSTPKEISSVYSNSPRRPSTKLVTLFQEASPRSSPHAISSSVVSSCYCSTPSTLKLLKHLNSGKLPSKAKSPPSSTPSDTPVTVKRRTSSGRQSAGKESKPLNVKPLEDEDAYLETLSTANDYRTLLALVEDRVRLEKRTVPSAENSGRDVKTVDVQEKDQTSSEEGEITREIETVVEWAKDTARLESDGSGDDDLDDEQSSDSYTDKRFKEAAELTRASTLKKKKRWTLF